MRVITGITSCKSRPRHSLAIRETYFPFLPRPFFFVGDPGNGARRQGDTLFLDAPDTYEHLPRKLFALYQFILDHEEFDWFLKLDDDAYVDRDHLSLALRHLQSLPKARTHYAGRIVSVTADNEGAFLWHAGKVSDPALDRRFNGVFASPYCAGGGGVVISRTAMRLLVTHGRERFLDPEEIYEDKLHGEVLGALGIAATPYDCHFVVPNLSPEDIRRHHALTLRRGDGSLHLVVGNPPPTVPGYCCIRWTGDEVLALPLHDGAAATLTLCENLANLSCESMANLLSDCRRVLSVEGWLLIDWPETWADRNTDGMPWTKFALQEYLLASGFSIEPGNNPMRGPGRFRIMAKAAVPQPWPLARRQAKIILIVEADENAAITVAEFLNVQPGFSISTRTVPGLASLLEHIMETDRRRGREDGMSSTDLCRLVEGLYPAFPTNADVVGIPVTGSAIPIAAALARLYPNSKTAILRLTPPPSHPVDNPASRDQDFGLLDLSASPDLEPFSILGQIEGLLGVTLDRSLARSRAACPGRPSPKEFRSVCRLPLPPYEGPDYMAFDGGKIAFLFLTRGDVHHPRIWEEYFSESYGSHEIYLHAKEPALVRSPLFREKLVAQSIPTEWGNISIVRATIALLSEALDDPENRAFVLCSESCLPVRPFAALLRHLKLDPNGILPTESVNSLASRDPMKASRHLQCPAIPVDELRFHPQWFLMGRLMAEAATELDATQLFENMFAPDEAYFGTVLGLRKFPSPPFPWTSPMTYSCWENGGPHPSTFDVVSKPLLESITSSGAFFARKFGPHAELSNYSLHRP